jgi:3-deoxy-D-manno-octulosonic-acid transferase
MTTGMLQTVYRSLTQMGGPVIRYYLHRRRLAGKEDPIRQDERLGLASRPRPPGPLVWVHAASVGESLSILILVNRLIAAEPRLRVLVTTGTVTSAQLMAQRLPVGAFHQFVPVDRPGYVARFLDHWRPDLTLWIESEIWPNMLWEIRRRHLPAALVNARMSERSFRRWRHVPGFIGPLLGAFRVCLAQTAADAERLRGLGATTVTVAGNLKFSSEPPPAADAAVTALSHALSCRPVWLLASGHPGEDAIAATVHKALAPRFPGLLTMIAPRHPHRGGEIQALLSTQYGLTASQRSKGALPTCQDDIYIADTLGEMGVLYRLAPVVWVGGSLVPHGGQNPIEPAQLGCALVFGPHMGNFAEIAAQLIEAGAAVSVEDGAALAGEVGRLLADSEHRRQLAEAAGRVTAAHRQVVLTALATLRPLLMEVGIAPPDTGEP